MQVIDDVQLQKQVDKFLEARPGGERILVLVTLPAALAGTLYGYLEYEYKATHRIVDPVFIVLLSLATVFLGVGVLFLRRKICQSAVLLFRRQSELRESKSPDEPNEKLWQFHLRAWRYGVNGPGELLQLIFHRKCMVLSGIGYGICLGLAPIILDVHSDNLTVRGSLMFFMFAANAVTGAAFYSALMLLRQSWHLAKKLDVSFFERRSETVYRYSQLLAATSVIGAIYIGMCQASVVFSVFSGVWVYGYALFAIGVFIGVYYVPQIPIRRRLQKERTIVLEKLDASITEIFSNELTVDSFDKLAKIFETERRIVNLGLGLSARNASVVTVSAIASAMLPYCFSIGRVLLEYMRPW